MYCLSSPSICKEQWKYLFGQPQQSNGQQHYFFLRLKEWDLNPIVSKFYKWLYHFPKSECGDEHFEQNLWGSQESWAFQNLAKTHKESEKPWQPLMDSWYLKWSYNWQKRLNWVLVLNTFNSESWNCRLPWSRLYQKTFIRLDYQWTEFHFFFINWPIFRTLFDFYFFSF